MMPSVQLTDSTQLGKWGHVQVVNPDGSLNREYKISDVDLASALSGTVIPTGVTIDEWNTCKIYVWGKDFNVGDMRQNADGSVTIKTDEDASTGKIIESYLLLATGDYAGKYPHITVLPDVIAKAEVNGLAKRPSSITGGIMVI